MPCDAVRSPTDTEAVWWVRVFGTDLHNLFTWQVGVMEHGKAHELVDQWNAEKGICTYEVRHD